MKLIYMDNYRGFRDAFIPIAKVNFLVGENSTGKSSLLRVVSFLTKLIDSSLLVGDASRSLGLFRDNVTASSSSKTFHLGWAEVIGDDNGGFEVDCGSIVVGNNKDIPVIQSYAEKKGSHELSVTLRPTGKYAVAKVSNSFPSLENARDMAFSFVRSCGKCSCEGLSPFDTGGIERVPFPLVPMMLLSVNDSGNDAGHAIGHFSARFPLGFSGTRGIEPIRTPPRRYYDLQSASFEHDGYSSFIELNRIAKSRKKKEKRKLERLRRFGKDSGLFDDLETASLGSASLGSPFEVMVTYDGAQSCIKNVGYGVSQILPLLMECISPESGACYLFQQPEVHLHPRAQAAFGGLLYDSMMRRKGTCLIETHSDYLIDRFRLARQAAGGDDGTCQVLFFERRDGINLAHPLEIDDRGRYPEDQPESFRSFFLSEAFRTLELS